MHQKFKLRKRSNSDPQESIVKINGEVVGTTPCVVSLKKKNTYNVIFEKEGYEDSCVFVNQNFEPVFLGNLILGGPVGMLVDFLSGAVYKLSPEKTFIKLQEKTDHSSTATE